MFRVRSERWRGSLGGGCGFFGGRDNVGRRKGFAVNGEVGFEEGLLLLVWVWWVVVVIV